MATRKGNGRDDRIEGANGADTFGRRGGDDIPEPQRGDDVLDGGSGRDAIDFREAKQLDPEGDP